MNQKEMTELKQAITVALRLSVAFLGSCEADFGSVDVR